MSQTVLCSNPVCGKPLRLTSIVPPGTRIVCSACKQTMTIGLPAGTATLHDELIPETPDSTESSPGQVAGIETVSQNIGESLPAANSRNLPKSIGRFQVRRFLGEGAFGAVYEGYDPQLDRGVAIKVAKLGSGDSSQRVKRFLREAKSAAGLRHPHIVPVHEFGQDGDQFFIVSEFIQGRTLQDSLKADKDKKPDLARAVRIVRQLAEALAYAHGQGIVHRDVKPANVMLDDKDEPMLMDFGLATRQEEAERLTHAGTVLGTPLYMAPEQALGHEAGVVAASDQYSLGVMLFEMITGQPPFTGTPEIVMFHHVEREPPRPSKLNPTVSRDLETICLKCLEKRPERRYASEAGLAEDLRRHISGEAIAARPVGAFERLWRWSRRKPAQASLVGLSVLSLMVVAGGAASLVYSSRVARERDRAEQLQDDFDYSRHLMLAQLELEAGDQTRAARILDECNWSLRGWEWRNLRRKTFLLNTIDGQGVRTACISPDGKLIASGTFSNVVWLWDATSGKPFRALEGHKGQVTSVRFSPDGQRLASGSDDKTARVWDLKTGEVLHVFEGCAGRLNSICFSPDGQSLAASGQNNTVLRWDVQTGKALFSFQGHTSEVTGLCYSPDGKQIASSGGLDNTVRVWDVRKNQTLTVLTSNSEVTCVDFSPDGEHIVASGSVPKKVRKVTAKGISWETSSVPSIRLWSAHTGKELRDFEGHTAGVRSVCFSPDGLRLASGSSDKTVQIWDVRTGKSLRAFRGTDAVDSVCFSSDGQRLVCGNWMTIRIWDARIDQDCRIFQEHARGVKGLWFSPDGQRLASATEDWIDSPELYVWDVASGQATLSPALKNTLKDKHQVPCACFSPDGKQVAIARGRRDLGSPCEILVCDGHSGQIVKTLVGHTGEIDCICYSRDGKLLASAAASQTGKDKTVRLWDLSSGKALLELQAENKDHITVRSLCFSPDGKRLVGSGVNSSRIYVWDTQTGHEIQFQTHGGFLNGGGSGTPVSYSPDGTMLGSGSGPNLQLRDARTGKVIHNFGNTERIFSLCFSPDGQRLATGGDDGSIRLWDVRTGHELLTLRGHTGKVSSVCFSPDGQRLASGSHDKTIRLWDARAGVALRELYGIDNYGMSSVGFSGDLQRVVARAGLEGQITQAWNLQTGRRNPVVSDPPPPIEPQLEAKSSDGNAIAWIYGYREANGRATVWSVNRVLVLRSEDDEEVKENDLAIGTEWHIQRALEAEKSEAWFAAAIHRDRLAKLQPGNQKKAEEAVAAWKRAGYPERAGRVAKTSINEASKTGIGQPTGSQNLLADRTAAPIGWLRTSDGLKGTSPGSTRKNDDGQNVRVAPTRKFVFPGDVSVSYRLNVEFTRLEGDWDINVILPVGKQTVMLQTQVDFAALEQVDGKPIRAKVSLPPNQRHRLQIDVHQPDEARCQIIVTINGKEMLRYDGLCERISLRDLWKVDRPRAIGLGLFGSTAVFHEARLTPLDNGGQPPGKASEP